jgi:hypothetical protein
LGKPLFVSTRHIVGQVNAVGIAHCPTVPNVKSIAGHFAFAHRGVVPCRPRLPVISAAARVLSGNSSPEQRQQGYGEHRPKRNDDQPEDPIVPQDDV